MCVDLCRQCLGHVLLVSGQVAEARRAFEEDLVEYPENGWSLLGLQKAAEAGAGTPEEAEAFEARVKRAFAQADVMLGTLSPCPAFD